MKQTKASRHHALWRTPLVPLLAGYFFTGLFATLCQAEGEPQQRDEIPQTHDNQSQMSAKDSLREEIRQLRHRAQELRNRSAAIRSPIDSTTPPAEEPATRAHVTAEREDTPHKDTVQLLSRESTDSFLASLRGRKRSTRERGYGGAIGPSMGVYAIGMGPVHELIDFIGANSNFSRSLLRNKNAFAMFQCSGITGYGAVGNGLRIGGSYMSGSRSYTSFQHDTTYNIEIKPRFGGFLLERAIVLENTNLFYGGIIGGSKITVRPSKTTNSLTSITFDSNEDLRVNFSEFNAASLLLELHGGFTYTMTNWFHIGADLSAPLFFSNSGFVTTGEHSITNGFLSINPGIRIRILIGNIG